MQPDRLAGRHDRVVSDRLAEPVQQAAQARAYRRLVGFRPQHLGDTAARQGTPRFGENRHQSEHMTPPIAIGRPSRRISGCPNRRNESFISFQRDTGDAEGTPPCHYHAMRRPRPAAIQRRRS